MCFEVLWLDAWTFKIFISPWLVNWFSLSLLFTLKYTLPDINITTQFFYICVSMIYRFPSFYFWLIGICYISSGFCIGNIHLALAFLFNLTISAIWLWCFNHLYLIRLLIWFGFSLPSCNLFSLCLISFCANFFLFFCLYLHWVFFMTPLSLLCGLASHTYFVLCRFII